MRFRSSRNALGSEIHPNSSRFWRQGIDEMQASRLPSLSESLQSGAFFAKIPLEVEAFYTFCQHVFR